MGISQVSAWKCTCDCCGDAFNTEGGTTAMTWINKEDLEEWLTQEFIYENWYRVADNYYCFFCVTKDDDGNLIVKKTKPTSLTLNREK